MALDIITWSQLKKKADLVGGKVPAGQLPSYVDDVLEYSSVSAFPQEGEQGKIYVALDTNKTYRWSGSGYIEISASLTIGETSSTAGRGDWTKTAYDHTSLTNNPHSVTKEQVGLSNVDDTSDLDKPISTAQQTALNSKVDKVEGKGLSENDYTDTDKQSVEKIPTIEQDILELENDKVDKNNAITAGTKAKITYDSKGLVKAGADLVETDIPELPQSKITDLGTDLGNKVNKNADIVGATKTKITYDEKGLVTGGADLVESDIPPLAISKITGLQTVLDDIGQNGIPYITTAPTSANTNGNLIMVVLTSEPTTKYAGYFYIITEE